MSNKSNINNRSSVNLLPTYFQTEKNKNFLASTIDELYKVPVLQRIDGYVGSKLTPTYNPSKDVYIDDRNITSLRQKYQFQPALTIKNEDQVITKGYGIDDLINQLLVYGAKTDNLSRIFSPKVNSYNPHIDWDKFVNFREYYWLPNGPETITITGLQRETVSTYTVTDSENGAYFVFTPDGRTDNPLLTFYKDVTYVLNINTKSNFYLKSTNALGAESALTEVNGVFGNGTSQIIFTVAETLPGTIYYASENTEQVIGSILIRSITENSSIDVESEIVGKLNYKTAPTVNSPNGIELVNGMRINFAGNVTPEYYQNREFIVEGVGSSITLVDYATLQTPEDLAILYDDDFDTNPFDDFPFDNFKNLPLIPEYVTINRASRDLNPWSRYNRWFHVDVINISAQENGIIPVLPLNSRAKRPIVEFEANLQLYNFGNNGLTPVDLMDLETTDAFSTIEGSLTYTVDGVTLSPGQRIIFNVDLDPMVRGKVFEVQYALINGQNKINLVEVVAPVFGNTVVIMQGTDEQGTEWYHNGSYWVPSQRRTRLNQAPLFDLFDGNGNSYSDKTYYDSIFSGNKIFGYAVGTGTPDSVLGFPLVYKNVGIEGSFLFQNYFNTDTLSLLGADVVDTVSTSETFIKKYLTLSTDVLENIWVEGVPYNIPVQQVSVATPTTNEIPVVVYNNSGLVSDLSVDVFANSRKLIINQDYTLTVKNAILTVVLINLFLVDTTVLINCYSLTPPNSLGVYEAPINLTNNPLNGDIPQFTLAEISDHVETMTQRDPRFVGVFPGESNLKSLPDITKYGTRIITNNNPLSFAQLYFTDVKNNLIDAIRSTSFDYYQFRLNLMKFIGQGNESLTSAEVLDQALESIITNKNSSFPYALSDMLGYGTNNISRTYTVTDSRNVIYPLATIFNSNELSTRSVLVYLNDEQLILGKDYRFDTVDPNVVILTSLIKGDVLVIKDYITTVGSYVPPTPSKLGLYPKYEPSIYIDNSYATGNVVIIEGHDGSRSVAYTSIVDFQNNNIDFRDQALLEYEKRVFNNIKVTYDPGLININDILPGVFRDNDYTYEEIADLIYGDFLKWTSTYNIDYQSNSTFDIDNYKTYNYSQAKDNLFNSTIPGNWRGIYYYYFDTDRPDTAPWEMLGFSIKPSWWEDEYGPAPYTSGNLNLWQDLEAGLIRRGERAGVDPVYVRPGLSEIIPVDDSGNIVPIRDWGPIADNGNVDGIDGDWKFGDCGPGETAWKRSSLWPYAVQIILALAKPADYAAKMFDPIRLIKDATGQYRYGPDRLFLNPSTAYLNGDVDANGNTVLSSGYSVIVIENGKKRSVNYLSNLKQDLAGVNFNLFYKAGGFLSKDKLEIIIDSVNPSSASPGAILPNEDYTLLFNTSNPIRTVSASGIIVEKRNGKFLIRGYDRQKPFFLINLPIHRASDTQINVGGKSAPFFVWKENTVYTAGQYVKYGNTFYTAAVTANSGTTFDPLNFIKLRQLPVVGGASVLITKEYSNKITQIPYGTQYSTLQDVYDIIVGYGKYLENLGFIFDDYSADLGQIIDWTFSGKEFLYWTTQTWAPGTVITLSPFSKKLQYKFNTAVVDNVLDSFYEYTLQKADGRPFPYQKFELTRKDGLCTISTENAVDGLFFAKLNLVQKEHVIVLNNTSMFGDIIYDIETGYRQARMQLSGFITGDWDGDFLSPGFVFDEATISDWQSYTDYKIADVVKYSGKYYSANTAIDGSADFNFNDWTVLGEAPVAELLPNFDYKINQFEDFYSLDIDNFDVGQQKMAQHLTGYTPRPYLTNIILDPIAQYKFYQGFIKEKGTANSIIKLTKASVNNLAGKIEYNEEWALRVGSYGNYTSYNEVEFPLREADFKENTQIVKFVNSIPVEANSVISYILPKDVSIKPDDYDSNNVFDTSPSTYDDNNLILPTAGYVKIDDVTATAYNRQSLLDVSNISALNEGDTIWIGFTSNGSWDVLRYTKQLPNVIASTVDSPSDTLTFTTDVFHTLGIGDIITVVGLNNGTDGIYEVKGIPSKTQFSVATTLTSASPATTIALLFKFISVRATKFDDIDNLDVSIDFKYGNMVWADQGAGVNSSSKWAVYRKIDNFTTSTQLSGGVNVVGQKYGTAIATQDGATLVLTSAPNYYSATNGYGRVFAFGYEDRSTYPIANYTVHNVTYKTVPNGFGYSLVYDEGYDIVVAGAPLVNLLQVSYINRGNNNETFLLENIAGSTSTARYASTLYLAKTEFTSNSKNLLVGSPGEGLVYVHKLFANITTNTSVATLTTGTSINLTTGTNVDYEIVGNSNGSKVAIGVPFDDDNQGAVYIYNYNGTSYSLNQTISIPSEVLSDGQFGHALAMTDDASYLFVSSLTVPDAVKGPGKVYVYTLNATSGQYEYNQTIHNPVYNTNLYFGHKIEINESGNLLLVSSTGRQISDVTFDGDTTTFDSQSTYIVDYIDDSGSVYTFERLNELFIYAQELFDKNAVDSVNGYINGYGNSLAINGSSMFIGAPTARSSIGSTYLYNKLDTSSNSWSAYRVETDLVDLSKVRRAITIDTVAEEVVDYIEIIDPLKGRINGLADQEIRYKTAFDPAVYSLGTQSVVVDTNKSWIEDHVGELWWDLSTAKYVWYEQGDLDYRKNTWGKLFPGASIDVYEWVQSEYLPSQWSALADTVQGLAQGISGQPKYIDNSVVSVKQYYNPLTAQSTNIYFFWVKNSVLIPDVSGRRMSAAQVSSLIFDPAANGVQFLSIIASNAVAVTNVKPTLRSNDIYLNIAKDEINSNVNKHTEWVLLGEGNPADEPTPMLNKKLIDSLVGRDSLGNLVPDPSLSDREKYGILIRPRQSMFVDRTAALRNAVDYANGIMSQYLISDIADFRLLNSKEEIPSVYSREYDRIVESYDDLEAIITIDIVTAELTCGITNGRVSSIQIVNSGTNYSPLVPVELDIYGTPVAWAGPTVKVVGDLTGIQIETTINSTGNITTATIVNAGNGLLEPPVLEVRPYTVIVQVDSNSNNRWASYELDNNKWYKIHTQSYNTTQYWRYVNWTSTTYDALKPLAATVAETYMLETLSPAIGDYVRVNNQGNGRYVVLQKVTSGGTFSDEYDLVLSENGTISLNDNLWNTVNNNYNFDYYFTFDQTLYDQTPERELVNILNALKDDIFVGSLRVYWNELFFASVKYAMTEQKFLDWAFKTSFINVRNIAGDLVQSPVYKFANSSYYEDYIKEVKPYHTKIRNYQVDYSVVDPTRTYTTDFDLPAYYDQETGNFIAVEFDSQLLNTYPWKAWNDNHALHVERIIVETTGSGYTSVPVVQIIAAPGDPGTGATAEAYITLGKVVRIDVINPGSGYLETPTVLISGGGSTSLTPARAYPIMGNGKVRNNSVEIKFDRVSSVKEISTSTAVDEFIGNGSDNEFQLSWAAENRKADITLTLNGIRVLATDYAIETYKELTNGYQKLHSKLVLNEVPATSSTISIVYKKNINLYHAVDRIYDYYAPTVGMPGVDPAQLMNGTEYPGAQIGGLPFDYSTNWDITPFGESLYGDDSLSYTTATVVSTALTGTNTLVLSSVNSIVPGLRVNTVALNTATVNENKFDTTIVTVLSVNTGSSSVTFSTVTIDTIVSGSVQIEFWDFNLTPGVLDTILDGGDLAYTNATGVNPEDILVDGDKFISPYVSYGPEELIRGELHESVGINVYTRSGGGAPVISQRYEQITQTSTVSTFRLMMLPASNDAVMVNFLGNVLEYSTDYSINYVDQTITINTQTQTGVVGITIVGVGGDEFITSDSKTSSNTTSLSVDIGIGAVSVYATLNGVELTSSQYIISNGTLTVSNLTVGTEYTLQAWSFFSSTYSAVREENFINSGSDTSYLLTTVPGDTWSANSQAIVEIDSRILTAPDTTYYSVNYGDTVFLVDPYDTYAPNTFSISEIEVYVNGLRLRNNIDFVLVGAINSIKFKPGFLQTGDVMAITNWTFADYFFSSNYIHIEPSANYQTGNKLKVITFTDATDSLIRTEVFRSRSSRRYPLSRPVLNSRYVWVSVGGKALINGIDYTLDEETTTVLLRSTYPYVPGEMVNIITMVDTVNNLSIAYRVFTDMLDRTQFKRLSGGNTTQLAEPLYNTSTTIVVEDTSGLAIPVPSAKKLGVVLVGRERIEYRYMTGNTLSGLTRATLGTGAGDMYPAGTQVIDQSMAQNLPYSETKYQQIVTATTTTNSYTIGGILLTTATVVDQFLVYYGGIQLRKAGMYVQNTDLAYDNTPSNIIGTVSTSTALPATKIIGTAYLVTATNQVWTYVDSLLTTAINGYIYSGLDYLPAEFTITNVVSSNTATLVLNLTTVTNGVNISLIQRVANNNFYASTATSLIDDTGIIANFLRDQPMPIPDKYYYGTT